MNGRQTFIFAAVALAWIMLALTMVVWLIGGMAGWWEVSQ